MQLREAFEKNKDDVPVYDNNYFERVNAGGAFLAAGYMQSRDQADVFILNSLALAVASDKKTINIITNFEVDNKHNELFYGEKVSFRQPCVTLLTTSI